MRSVISITSSMSWEMKITLDPDAVIERISPNSLSTPLARQEWRRLVEQNQAGAAGGGTGGLDLLEGAHDGEQRPLDRRDLVDALMRVERQPEAAERAAGGRLFGAPVDEACWRRW